MNGEFPFEKSSYDDFVMIIINKNSSNIAHFDDLYSTGRQACQTHFGIRAKFFENLIQNSFAGHKNIFFLISNFSVHFDLNLAAFYYGCKL